MGLDKMLNQEINCNLREILVEVINEHVEKHSKRGVYGIEKGEIGFIISILENLISEIKENHGMA